MTSVPGVSTPSQAHLAWPTEPYKGLSFFGEPDAPLFTQRDEDVEDCATRLDDFATRVLLLHGLSGTGKSSFLRAGLVPRLQEPPDHGCKFFFLQDRSGEPVMIRATDDPIARIHTTLLEATRTDECIPASARTRMQAIMSRPLAADRREAADTLLSALQCLSSGLRDIFMLVIDQAEEVLTLPRQSDTASNRRVGFFYFLEELCHQRLDMRAIVVFRTEYYGQFCSFFQIPPTLSVTSAALPRAGSIDYLLRRIDDPGRIAAALRQPTLKHPVKGLPAPHATYGFEYAPGVAEQIAQDLVEHSGDASALPVMQVVCKDLYEHTCKEGGRSTITQADYQRIGCVQGALDLHINNAIRGALRSSRQCAASDTDVDRWRMTLSGLVGRQEGAAVTSLIAREDQLVSWASDHGVGTEAATVLGEMAQEPWRILRTVEQQPGEGRTFSLGHDCLGPALWRWSERHSERLRADEEAEKRMARQQEAARRGIEDERRLAEVRLKRQRRESRFMAALTVAGLITFGAASLLALEQTYLPRRQAVSVLNSVAMHQGSSHLRERILLLLTSLDKTKTWPWSRVIGSQEASEELKKTLLRAPVFGGAFAAGLAPNGGRLAYLEYNRDHLDKARVAVLNLATGKPELEPLPADLTGVLDPQMPRPPSVGFVDIESPVAKPGEEAVVIAGVGGGHFLVLNDRSSLLSMPAALPQEFLANAAFPPMVDFGAGRLRFVRWHPKQGLIDGLSLLTAQASGSPDFRLATSKIYDLDWQPADRSARRQPVLAEDCNSFAFMGRREEPQGVEQVLWMGQFDGPAQPRPLTVQVPQGDQGLSSLTVARGCGAVVARVPGKLIVLDLQGKAGPLTAEQHLFGTPAGMAGFVLSSFPLASPPLAAAPRLGEPAWRIAWMVENGVAVADASVGTMDAKPLLEGASSRPLPFLTGLDNTANVVRLTISRDADFLMIAQQRSFAAMPDVRVFDLRIEQRQRALEAVDLRTEACRVAEFLGGNEFRRDELGLWLGTEEATKLCSNRKDQ
jgi:hypothetical protein